MTNMNVILEAKDIIKTYGYEDNKIYATNHIDLQIEEGSFVAIVGRSGSGKSTAVRPCAGSEALFCDVPQTTYHKLADP